MGLGDVQLGLRLGGVTPRVNGSATPSPRTVPSAAIRRFNMWMLMVAFPFR